MCLSLDKTWYFNVLLRVAWNHLGPLCGKREEKLYSSQTNGRKFNWKTTTDQNLKYQNDFRIFKEAINLEDTGTYSCIKKSKTTLDLNPVQSTVSLKLDHPCLLCLIKENLWVHLAQQGYNTQRKKTPHPRKPHYTRAVKEKCNWCSSTYWTLQTNN